MLERASNFWNMQRSKKALPMTSCIAGLTLPLVDALHPSFQSPSSLVDAFFLFLLHELGLVVAQGLESSFEG